MTTDTTMDNEKHNHHHQQQPKQKKARKEEKVGVEAAVDDDEEDALDSTYVVVTETYPTKKTYNRGQMIKLTKEVVSKDFDTYEAALEHGLELRDASKWFTDYEYRDTTDEGEGVDDTKPPWDSAKTKNEDNDEEVRIQIMTVMEYDDFAYDQQLFLEDEEREERRAQKIDQRA